MSHSVAAESYAIGDDVAAHMSVALRALADPQRLRMLSLVASAPSGEVTAGDLASLTDVSQPTVSHHLKVLRDVGVLSSDRRGTWVWYRLTPRYRTAVGALLDAFAPAAVGPDVPAPAHEAAGISGLADVERELERVAHSLATRVPGTEKSDALRVVRESYTALARRGGVTAHLVTLTEHFARQRLADAARVGSGADADRPHVLFVCVGNAGRSQLAAALLRHHAGDRVIVRSAGSAPARDVHAPVRQLLAELGQDSDDAFPKPLTDDAVRAADVVVTMGCGDRVPRLPGKRYEDWPVGDPALASPTGLRAVRDDLDARVRALLADLEPHL